MLKFQFLKFWILLVLIFSASLPAFAQKPIPILFSEVHAIPGDSGNTVYYSYRIPFSNLVFEKKGNSYSANFRILIEVTDSLKKFITRQIGEKNPAVKDFEQTNSKNLFYEGVFSFHLSSGTYFLNPVFTDLNSGREINLEPIYLPLSATKSIFQAIVLTSDKFSCNGKSLQALSNFNDNFPFGEAEHEFIIPTSDTSISNLYILIVNNRDTIFNGQADGQLISSLDFIECGGRILSLINEENHKNIFKLFTVKAETKNLYEGILSIFASKSPFDAKAKPERVYNGRVSWYNKPLSLSNPEIAVKMLKYIESDSLINGILSHKEEEYPRLLFDYWKKFDPTPQTAFNPLMQEYYSRVDYAQKNFSTISGTRGIDSDRGKVFIKFGKPSKIERNSDEYGKIVETWSYEKLQKRFVFIDRQGTGEFLLRNG
ncbi:MAG TPA: GWxTD domain-containing protein [Ignavibacteriaceae bacterium]|nr:GWxTD domain-containing protein [Ignavibacteriaceae bacterium]